MTSFCFVHAADLHLGSPFRGLSMRNEDVSIRFAQATRQAFRTLIDQTLESQARFLVIAGDVYDGAWKDASVGLFFNREVARLGRAGVPVFVLRGNHDAESVVTQSVPLPESVHRFSARAPQSHVLEELGVVLHGQSFANRQVSENLASCYPTARPGMFNIGVLHTSLTGRPPHADYAPCSISDLLSKGYDYWALGHVHQYERVHDDPPVVFPGNLQGRNIRETGEKGAVLVSVEDHRVRGIERLVVDQARWIRLDIDVSDIHAASDLSGLVRGAAEEPARSAGGRLIAIRIRLTGTTQLYDQLLAQRRELAEEVQAALHHTDEDLWLEKLELDLAAPAQAGEAALETLDLRTLLEDPELDIIARAAAQTAIGELNQKLTHSTIDVERPFDENMSDLIAAARATLLARAGGGKD